MGSGPLTSLPKGRGQGSTELRVGARALGSSLALPTARSPPNPGQPASLPIHVRPGWAVELWCAVGLILEPYWFRQPAR